MQDSDFSTDKFDDSIPRQLELIKIEREEFASKISYYEQRIYELKISFNREHLNYVSAIKAKEKTDQELEDLKREYAAIKDIGPEVLEKARKYDAGRQIIAKLILKAQKDSRAVVDEAKSKSDMMIAEAYNSVETILNQINNFKTAFNSINNDISDVSRKFSQLSDVIVLINTEISKLGFKEPGIIIDKAAHNIEGVSIPNDLFENDEMLNEYYNRIEKEISLMQQNTPSSNEKIPEDKAEVKPESPYSAYELNHVAEIRHTGKSNPAGESPVQQNKVIISDILKKYSK